MQVKDPKKGKGTANLRLASLPLRNLAASPLFLGQTQEAVSACNLIKIILMYFSGIVIWQDVLESQFKAKISMQYIPLLPHL